MIVICSSSDPQQLRALLATLDPTSFRGVISFGVAGGLDPSLKSGDVVVATEVMAGGGGRRAGLSPSGEPIFWITPWRRRILTGGPPRVGEGGVGGGPKGGVWFGNRGPG